VVTDPLIGRQLGNYRIERLLGRGGMASVYYAMDVLLNRPVAVKVINTLFRNKEKYHTRFVREARAVATWRHENIVQVYYAGEEDGLSYFAMEYIDGTTLAQILVDQTMHKRLLPPADVLRYGRAIANALDYAHRKGVIHRDVKPLNVLVAGDGRIVLSDFGLALDTAQGSLGEVFGTALYTSPEQARRSNSAVPQSDLYSLGVILYEILTGRVPFDDPSPTSVALQHITLAPPSPRKLNPELNEAVEAVLLRALSKKPAERFQTGAALMDALEAALQGNPFIATRPTPVETRRGVGLPTVRQAAWLPWLGLVIILCLVLGVGVGYTAIRLMNRTIPQKTIQTALTPAGTQTAVVQFFSPTDVTPTFLPSLAETQPILISTPVIPPLLPATSPIESTVTPIDLLPSSTPKYTDRRHFILFYNETSFYMLQAGGPGDLIGGVAFERLGTDLQSFDRFSGNRWSKYSPSSLANWCYRLEIADATGYLNPPVCTDHYMATLTLRPEGSEIFWTLKDNSQFFRVLWHEEELTRCEVAAGSCEVYLP